MSFGEWLSKVLRGAAASDERMPGLASIGDLNQALARSEREALFIYKHSTTCPVSAAARGRLAAYLDSAGDGGPPFYMVQVLESRAVSDAVAERLGVTHQSPQLILVKGRRVVWNASHGGITRDAIREALTTAAGV
ncbi:MAG: bacillithiol system redox-active protein YtxJ [Candidatus Krumholzibacteriia bacterium]